MLRRLALLCTCAALAACASTVGVGPQGAVSADDDAPSTEAALASTPAPECRPRPGVAAAGSGTGPSGGTQPSRPPTDLEAVAADTTSVGGEDWRHFLTLYGWVPSFRGDVTVSGLDSEPSLSRSDILDNLDIAYMGRYEVVPPESDWSFWFDAFYSKLQDDGSATTDLSPIDADFEARMSFVELAASYHAWRSEATMSGLQKQAARTQADVFGGARYARMRLKLDIDAPGIGASFSFDEKEDWWDPMVGARVRHGLSPTWWMTLRGDIGGFGIGTSSDFAWTATATIQHLITEDLSVGGGWKIMDLDYERGEFKADIQLSGPFITLTYEF